MIRRGSLWFALAWVLAEAAHASPSVYTNAFAFAAALPPGYTTAGFDVLASGTVIASGGAADGVTFSYSFDGASLLVTDGTAGGGGGPYETLSPANFIGSSDFDALLDGDTVTLGFASSHAIGIFIITAEQPGESLLDGDIGLSAGGATALLDVEAVQNVLGDGSLVYFLGVIDPEASFAAASLDTFGGGSAFSYAVDQVVTSAAATAVPLPGSILMAAIALFMLAALWLRRRGWR
jgi:hypothetical protein